MIKFGIFADAHYAKDKQYGTRYCDLSIKKLDRIIEKFNQENVNFVVCLGDTIDSEKDFKQDTKNLNILYDSFNKLDAPLHIVLGNHDLEAMSKEQFLKTCFIDEFTQYYSFMYESNKFIVLDANFKSTGESYERGNYRWSDSFIDEKQLEWLERELNIKDCDNVIIFIHQNLDPKTYDDKLDPHVVKNAKEIRELMEKSEKKITVVQGHYHAGYNQMINDIKYITLKALCDGSILIRFPMR